MDYREVLCEASNKLVNEVLTLITDDFYGAAEPTPNVLVEEFCCGLCRVVAQWFGLDPFCAVVYGHQNVLITRLCRGRGERPHEIQAPFLEWFQ